MLPPNVNSSTLQYHDDHLRMAANEGTVLLDGRTIPLTRKEFILLATLVANEGEIVPRQQLLQDVWGYAADSRTRTLDVHVRRLRRKLGELGEVYIETIFGVGYRFQRYRPAPAFRSLFQTAGASGGVTH